VGERGVDMDLMERLQDRFRARWVKIKFHKKVPAEYAIDSYQGVRFCEAVTESYARPLIISPETITCTAARHVFQWNGDMRSDIAKNIHEELNFPIERAEAVVNGLPRLKPGCRAIGLNQNGEPDVLVSYCQPEQVMDILTIYQQKTGETPRVTVFGVASLCASIAMAALSKKGLHLSFGCPNVRKYGRIGRDRLAIAVSREMAVALIE
jgi:uncharacterized protein (DUF169 family)